MTGISFCLGGAMFLSVYFFFMKKTAAQMHPTHKSADDSTPSPVWRMWLTVPAAKQTAAKANRTATFPKRFMRMSPFCVLHNA